MKHAIIVFVVLAVASLAVWLWSSSRQAPGFRPAHDAASPTSGERRQGPGPNAETSVTEPPAVDPLEVRDSRPPGEAGRRWVEMPDGTWMRALNDVLDAPKILWDRAVPKSPVVGLRTLDDGVTWFVHADGTLTTTTRLWRDDLAREDVTTLTQHPRDLDDAAELVRPDGQRRE